MIAPAHIRKASSHELLLALACAVAALTNLLFPGTQSLLLADALSTQVELIAYYAGVTAGAMAIVAGWVITERGLRGTRASISTGLQIEAVGLVLSGPLLAAYAVALFTSGAGRGVLAGSICLAVAGAHLLRAVRIGRDLQTLRDLLAAEVAALEAIEGDDRAGPS